MNMEWAKIKKDQNTNAEEIKLVHGVSNSKYIKSNIRKT